MESVRFERVSKRFVIRHQRARTFQEAALNLFKLRRDPAAREEFWALRDVSFRVQRGRTLGIVGRNGSGKSTLLKLLAGTMRPTEGRIAANGRVFGLLELAAGFHPELSGRENTFLNGTFLGLSRRQMRERLDQIVSFAELEQFIDTPVKHYSSGMYMRLGFAIAISVDPDILVIDEVLAVGDAAFRQKCFLALADFKARQKTILFVTHDAAAVRRFCDDAIWLDHGQVRGSGAAGDVLRDYLAETQVTHGTAIAAAGRPVDPLAVSSGPVSIVSVDTLDARGEPERHFQTGQEVGLRVRLRAAAPVDRVTIGAAVHRADGLYLFGASTASEHVEASLERGEAEAICWLGPVPLPAAEYAVSAAIWIGDPALQPRHRLSQAARFAVRPPLAGQAGVVSLQPSWRAAGALALSEKTAVHRALVMATAAAHDGEEHGARTPTRGAVPPRPEFRAGEAADQALPTSGLYARWRPAPPRIAMGEGEDEFLGPGWYPPEDWPPRVRWSARRASVYLTQDEWNGTVGLTMCRPQHDEHPTTGTISVDGRVAGHFALASPALEPFTFPLEPVDSAREVEIVIEVDDVLRPPRDDPAADRRELGVAVQAIWLE